MLYYHFRVPVRNKKGLYSVEADNQKTVIGRRTSELNNKSAENVWFYVVSVDPKYVDLCANIGYRCKDKPKDLARAFAKGLGFEPMCAFTKEVTTEDFAEYINIARKNGYIDDVGSILIRSTVGDYKECTSGKYRERIVDGLLSKEVIYSMMEDRGFSGFMKDEIDRILSAEGSDFKGHPVHYIIYSDDEDRRDSIIEVLLCALNTAGRLRSRRYSLVDGECTTTSIFDFDCIDEKLFRLYGASGGTAIVVCPTACVKGYDQPDIDAFNIKLSSLASDNRRGTLTILCFSKEERPKGDAIVSKMDGLRFVRIFDEGNPLNRIRSILGKKAEEDGFEDTESLLSRVDASCAGMMDNEIDKIYSDWVDEQLCGIFPQYKGFEKVCSENIASIKTDDAYVKLQSLIGLENAKSVIDRIIGYNKANRMFREAGIPDMDPSYHMVFTGSPGTAKTTVARLFARIMKDNGILPKGNLIEVGRQDLVGKYVGWTAKAVEEAFDKARGSVLFIDEAYSLCDGREGSFGDEAINAIVQMMENRRSDTVVIFAGYSDRMKLFLSRNPGLRSRISYHVDFEDYSVDQLMAILGTMTDAAHMHLSSEAENKVRDMFDTARQCSDFGNGRFARNLFEQARVNLAYRISSLDGKSVSFDTLSTILPEDFEFSSAMKPDPPKRRMGF